MSESLSFELTISDDWKGHRAAVSLGGVEVSSCQINEYWTEEKAKQQAIRSLASVLGDLVSGEYLSYRR